MADDADDFYEDDEPIEKIEAILERAPDGVTSRPDGPGVVVAGAPPVTASGNRLVGHSGAAVA